MIYLNLDFDMLVLMTILKRVLIVLLMILMAACATATPLPTITMAATSAPSRTPVSSTPTIPPATSTLTSSFPISSAPDELRMAYVIDGNLYLQDGSKPPFQLTHGGKDRNPTFSDDGEKLVFLRGLIPHELHSVNSDGSDEQVIVSSSILSALGQGYDELSELRSFAFVPGTHLLIFDTRELDNLDIKMQDWNRTASKNKGDLLIVDTDTGEIKTLLPPGKGGNFFISPDGNIVAIQSKGHIDLVSLEGQIIRQNLVTYTPTRPYELTPGIFWVDDSAELIVTLPVGVEYDMDGPETRSVWRYEIDGNAKVQISLNPPVIGNDYSISPNGNWIVYNYYYYPGKTDETVTSGLYFGNLREGGGTYLYSPDIATKKWGPDSVHFVYESIGQGLFLGAINESPVLIDDKGRFLDWVDASRYLYFYTSTGVIVLGEVSGGTVMISTNVPNSSLLGGSDFFISFSPYRGKGN